MTNGKSEDEIRALLSEASARAVPDIEVTWEVHTEHPGGTWDAEYTAGRVLSGNEKRDLLTIKMDLKRRFHVLT
jgi:hypothetical protein